MGSVEAQLAEHAEKSDATSKMWEDKQTKFFAAGSQALRFADLGQPAPQPEPEPEPEPEPVKELEPDPFARLRQHIGATSQPLETLPPLDLAQQLLEHHAEITSVATSPYGRLQRPKGPPPSSYSEEVLREARDRQRIPLRKMAWPLKMAWPQTENSGEKLKIKSRYRKSIPKTKKGSTLTRTSRGI